MLAEKKSAISINLIIIASIAMIVLVIITFFIYKQTSTASKEINDCESKGGLCSPECNIEYFVQIPAKCPNLGSINQKCCIKAKEHTTEIIVVNP